MGWLLSLEADVPPVAATPEKILDRRKNHRMRRLATEPGKEIAEADVKVC